MADAVTFLTFVTTFTDFLTVAIHTILYERSIYPQTSFLSARKYNYSVRQSRHPRVCKWITDAISSVETELLKGTVSRVAVVVYNSKTDTPLERFVFDLGRFPVVPTSEANTPLERTNETGDKVAVLPLVDLEEQLRATMARLSECGSVLKPVPSGCTFTIAIELRDESEPPIGHPQPWIPAQPGLQKTVSKGEDGPSVDTGKDVGGAKTTPMRSVAAGDMLFEVWVEEGKAKYQSFVSSEDG